MTRLKSGFRRRIGSGAVILVFLLGLTGLAWAAGHGESAHESGRILFYRILNFALLVVILAVVVKKVDPRRYFTARREDIEKRFRALNRQKAEVEAQYREFEARLKEFETKREEILRGFRDDGLAEKERIVAKARERAAQILSQADVAIQQEVLAAKKRILDELADAAAHNAHDLIARNVKPNDQEHLVNEFIERVEKLH